jgi:hypothetical protein
MNYKLGLPQEIQEMVAHFTAAEVVVVLTGMTLPLVLVADLVPLE